MGAWIEIGKDGITENLAVVAPYMGAWIEIRPNLVIQPPPEGSLPTWERGLKLILRLAVVILP